MIICSRLIKAAWIIVPAFAVSMLMAHAARASEPVVLGLEQLIQMALDTSPEIKEAEQDVKAAQSDLAQAKGGRWAQLELVATMGPAQNASEPIVAVDPVTFKGKLEDRDKNELGFFGRLDLAIVQPLYTFGKISNRIDAAMSGVEAQKAARLKKQGEIILNVKELYYGYIVANQGAAVAKDADGFIQDARKRIERLLEAGARHVSPSDLYRLGAYEAEIESFKFKAESGARLAYLALKKAVGFPDRREFRLDTQVLPMEIKELADQEQYISQALDQRPEFDQLKSAISAKKSLVRAAKADLYPSVFLAGIGSFAGAPDREELDISYFRDEFNHLEGGIVLGSAWHFDFGISQGRLEKARAEHLKVLHTKEFAERNIPLEVARHYQDCLEAQASFQAYEKAAVASRRWIVAAFSNFDFGVGTAKDMFDSIEKYGKNQGDFLLSLYNYNVSLARLSYAVGEYRSSLQ